MSSTTSDTTGNTSIDPQLEWLISSERPLFGVAAGLFGSAAAFQLLGWRWLAAVSGKLAPVALTGAIGVKVWLAAKRSAG